MKESVINITGKENLVWQQGKVEYKDRCEIINQKGLVIWFTGISAKYEEPDNPDIIIDTESLTINESVMSILNYIKEYIIEGKVD